MKWEYIVVQLRAGPAEERLNELGLEGWELVQILADYTAFLKRLNKEANQAEYERFWREEVGCAPPF